MKGRYVHLDRGILAAEESFVVSADGGARRVSVVKRLEASRGGTSWSVDAVLDPSWRVLCLEIKKSGACGQLSAAYRWDEDAWAGVIRGSGGASREVGVPMVSALDVGCPLAFFDTLFLKRASLAPLSQRRIEYLQVELEGLETLQTHQIMERLDGAPLAWKSRAIPADRYVVSDESGSQDHLWVANDGVCLLRTAGSDAEARYRLEDFSAG